MILSRREKKAIRDKLYRAKNREKAAQYHKQYRAEHREQFAEYHKQYYDKKRLNFLDRSRRYRLENPEEVAAYKKRYRSVPENREKIAVYQKEYRTKHREKAAQYRKQYWTTRMRTDPTFRITKRLRTRIFQAMRRYLKGEKTKAATSKQLIGCDMDWFIAWIEIQFQLGMSWENYGSNWSLDHIRPCASFDLANPEEQRRCFHWTNLQPLPSMENLLKRDKWKAVAP